MFVLSTNQKEIRMVHIIMELKNTASEKYIYNIHLEGSLCLQVIQRQENKLKTWPRTSA